MSQNLINDLTDRVSALGVQVKGLRLLLGTAREHALEQQAVIDALSSVLEDEFWNQDHHGRESARLAVQKIIEDARTEHRTKIAQES